MRGLRLLDCAFAEGRIRLLGEGHAMDWGSSAFGVKLVV